VAVKCLVDLFEIVAIDRGYRVDIRLNFGLRSQLSQFGIDALDASGGIFVRLKYDSPRKVVAVGIRKGIDGTRSVVVTPVDAVPIVHAVEQRCKPVSRPCPDLQTRGFLEAFAFGELVHGTFGVHGRFIRPAQ